MNYRRPSYFFFFNKSTCFDEIPVKGCGGDVWRTINTLQ